MDDRRAIVYVHGTDDGVIWPPRLLVLVLVIVLLFPPKADPFSDFPGVYLPIQSLYQAHARAALLSRPWFRPRKQSCRGAFFSSARRED